MKEGIKISFIELSGISWKREGEVDDEIDVFIEVSCNSNAIIERSDMLPLHLDNNELERGICTTDWEYKFTPKFPSSSTSSIPKLFDVKVFVSFHGRSIPFGTAKLLVFVEDLNLNNQLSLQTCAEANYMDLEWNQQTLRLYLSKDATLQVQVELTELNDEKSICRDSFVSRESTYAHLNIYDDEYFDYYNQEIHETLQGPTKEIPKESATSDLKKKEFGCRLISTVKDVICYLISAASQCDEEMIQEYPNPQMHDASSTIATDDVTNFSFNENEKIQVFFSPANDNS